MTATIPAERLGAFLVSRLQRLEDGPLPMGELVGIAQESVTKNFQSSSTPEGIAWQPRKNIGDGHPLLIDTAALFGAATGIGAGGLMQIEKREATIGVDGDVVPYGNVHNAGFPERNIPQREYMGMRAEDLERADDLLEEFCLDKVWQQD